MKKIDVNFFDLVIKINIQERREILIYDLFKKIDIDKLSHSVRL
jgi:hypothetical protein